MSSKKNFQKAVWSNCYTDLQRAATAFYLKPLGKTHQVFLDHALEILAKIEDVKSKFFFNKISELKKQTASFRDKDEVANLADKILTLGVMMR